MRNIYLAQPTNTFQNSVYLPYSIGAIAAYAMQFPEIKMNFNFCDFIFLKEDIPLILSSMENPFLVGFSCYIWNFGYNLKLAKAIKTKWKDCTILLGGPQISRMDGLLSEYPFLDILIYGEGEEPFAGVLKALSSGGDLSDIPNLAFRCGGQILETQSKTFCDLSAYPSPYTMGLFDSILKDPNHKDLQLDAIIETNRGCPYRCVFCTWGKNEAPVRQFPMERVFGDLEWLATHQIVFCFCADANFGMFPRDETIVDYLVALKKKHGFPESFSSNAAKEKDDILFRIYQKLNSAQMHKGVSIALQSLTPKVLKTIHRHNLSFSALKSQLQRYRDANIFTFVELILGLPAETYQSFFSSLFQVIEAGQHTAINIYSCELLPNSKLASEAFMKEYKIKTMKAPFCQEHGRVQVLSHTESDSEIVIGTSTLSVEEWKRATRFYSTVLAFHCFGLTRFLSAYYTVQYSCGYQRFYSDLFEYIFEHTSFIRFSILSVTKSLEPFVEGKDALHFEDSAFGNIYFPFEEGIFLRCTENLDLFYQEIDPFFMRWEADPLKRKELLQYQKAVIVTPGKESQSLSFHYQWLSFFKSWEAGTPEPLRPESVALRFEYEPSVDWVDYAKRFVWYGKKSNRFICKTITCER